MRKNHTSQSIVKLLALSVCLIAANPSHADTVTLTETQKDEVKCDPVTKDPDTGETFQDCFQNTTGTYSATIKLAEATFVNNQSLFTDIDADSPLGISIGEFNFTGSLSEANKKKLTATTAEGTWTEIHDLCIDEDCLKTKPTTYGTVKISRVKNKGATITFSGKSDNDSNGQKIVASLCQDNGTGTTHEDAVLSLGGIDISSSIQISCIVKSTTADENGDKGGPYDLNNMTIKAKLAPTTCSSN